MGLGEEEEEGGDVVFLDRFRSRTEQLERLDALVIKVKSMPKDEAIWLEKGHAILPKSATEEFVRQMDPLITTFTRRLIRFARSRGIKMEWEEVFPLAQTAFALFIYKFWKPDGGLNFISFSKRYFMSFFAGFVANSFPLLHAQMNVERSVRTRLRKSGELERLGEEMQYELVRRQMLGIHARLRSPRLLPIWERAAVPANGSHESQERQLIQAMAEALADFLQDPKIPQRRKEMFVFRIHRSTGELGGIYQVSREAISKQDERAVKAFLPHFKNRLGTHELDNYFKYDDEVLIEAIKIWRRFIPDEVLEGCLVLK